MKPLFTLLFLLFCSCTATHRQARADVKATRLMNRALHLSAPAAAFFTRSHFPCTTTAVDTQYAETVRWKDSLFMMPLSGSDTPATVVRAIPLKVPVHYITRTIMHKVEDSAAIILCNKKEQDYLKQLHVLQNHLVTIKRIKNICLTLLAVTAVVITLNVVFRKLSLFI